MQNPQITNGMPVAMENEVFVLSRAGIHFTAKSGRVKAEGSGNLFLSTLRMVFVADKGHHFDMPLATMHDEKFNQPIFGANNMTGQSPPLDLEPGAEDYKWCISFRNGGVGTFLPFFFRLLEEMRRRMQQAATPVVQAEPTTYEANYQAEPVPTNVAQGMVQAAYVDPSDPTTFYISVPK